MTTWRVCPWCDPESEDGNVWSAEAFGAAGNAYPPDKEPCSACYLGKYPSRFTECSECGDPMKTRGKGTPICRPCRRVLREAKRREAEARKEAERCTDCRRPRIGNGYRSPDGRCFWCERKTQRAAKPKRIRTPRPIPLRGKDVCVASYNFDKAA